MAGLVLDCAGRLLMVLLLVLCPEHALSVILEVMRTNLVGSSTYST